MGKKLNKVIMVIFLLCTIWLFADSPSPLILIHGLNGAPSDMNALETEVSSVYQFTNSLKVGYISNARIGDIATAVANQIETVCNKQAVVITHSMGGLVARQYMLNKQTSSAVKALITIGTPHTGTGLATTTNWANFISADIAAMILPPLLDCQPEKQAIVKFVSSPIQQFSQSIVEFAHKFFNFSDFSISCNWSVSLSDLVGALYSNAVYNNPCIEDMALGSSFISHLNSSTLPATGIEGKSIYYGSIYGTKNDLFTLLQELLGENGAVVSPLLGVIGSCYAGWGAYYVATGGWWNWVRTLNGLAYIAGGAIIFPPIQSNVYNQLLVGSLESDAVVPVGSQKLPRGVVPSGAQYIEPLPAPDANHLEETRPTEQVKSNLYYILDYAQVPKK